MPLLIFHVFLLPRPGTIEIFEVLMPPQVLAITTPHYKYHHDYATEIRHVQRAYVSLSSYFSSYFSYSFFFFLLVGLKKHLTVY